MIYNPIYDAPVYETISGNTQLRENHILSLSTAPVEQSQETVHSGHYVGEPTQFLSLRQQQSKLVKPVSLDTSYDYISAHKGDIIIN